METSPPRPPHRIEAHRIEARRDARRFEAYRRRRAWSGVVVLLNMAVAGAFGASCTEEDCRAKRACPAGGLAGAAGTGTGGESERDPLRTGGSRPEGDGGEISFGGEGGAAGSGGSEVTLEAELAIEGPSSVQVRVGGSVVVPLSILRANLAGPVRVGFQGLPAGIVADSELLDADRRETTLTLIATTAAATGGPIAVRLEAITPDGALSAQAELDLEVVGAVGTLDRGFGAKGLLRYPATEVVGVAVVDDGHIVLAAQGLEGRDVGVLLRSTPDGTWEGAPDFAPPREGELGAAITSLLSDSHGLWLSVLGYTDLSDPSTGGVLLLDPGGQPRGAFGGNGFAALSTKPNEVAPRKEGGAYVRGVEPLPRSLDASGNPAERFRFFDETACVSRVGVDAWDMMLVLWCTAKNGSARLGRISQEGALDESFGNRGELLLGESWLTSTGFVTSRDANGAWIGFGTPGGTSPIFKLHETGLDTSFGVAGRLDVDLGAPDFKLLPLGASIMACGTAEDASLREFNETGAPALDFGGNGSVSISGLLAEAGEADDTLFVQALAYDDERARIVVAGRLASGGIAVLRVWR